MRAWTLRQRRPLGVLLIAYAVAGTFLAVGSSAVGVTFLGNAEGVTASLATTRAAVSGALTLADASLETGARSVEGLGGSLTGSADVVVRAAAFADRVAGAADALANSLAAVSFLDIHPFRGPAAQFSGLATSAHEVGVSLTGIVGSLSSTSGDLAVLASNMRRLGLALTAIDASFADLPFGPQLADQFRLAALLLFAVAGWFLLLSLGCLGGGVILWRAASRSAGAAHMPPIGPGGPPEPV